MIINENYKIESDTLNVILFYRATGKKNWIPIGYYNTPKGCLEKLVTMEVNGTGLTDLKTIVKRLDEIEDMIYNLKGLPEPLQCLTDNVKGQKRYIHQPGEIALPVG